MRTQPSFTKEMVIEYIEQEFEMKIENISSLPSFDYQNWKIDLKTDQAKQSYILKIAYKELELGIQ